MVEMVMKVLSKYKLPINNEAECQDAIAQIFKDEGVQFEREVWLNEKDRIDFLCNRTGVEVKLHGSVMNVGRQLQRYDASDRLDNQVLVTARAMDPTPMGFSKPLYIHHISRSFL